MSDAEKPKTADEVNGLELDDDESMELQQVFSAIFPQYMEPLQELVEQLDGGSSAEILEGLEAALKPLAEAADSIGVTKLKDLLTQFQERIDAVADKSALGDEERDAIVAVYFRLKEAVDSMGDGSGAPAPRADSGGFVARLTQVEGVGPEEVQKVLAAGISTPSQVASARIDEIAAVTGLSETVARAIFVAFGGKERPARSKSGRGGGGQGSGGGFPEVETRPLTSAELTSRIAVVTALRERLRLEDLLNGESTALDGARRHRADTERVLERLRDQLRSARSALEAERSGLQKSADILEGIQDDIRRSHQTLDPNLGGGDEEGLVSLRNRLDALNQKLAKRLARN